MDFSQDHECMNNSQNNWWIYSDNNTSYSSGNPFESITTAISQKALRKFWRFFIWSTVKLKIIIPVVFFYVVIFITEKINYRA